MLDRIIKILTVIFLLQEIYIFGDNVFGWIANAVVVVLFLLFLKMFLFL